MKGSILGFQETEVIKHYQDALEAGRAAEAKAIYTANVDLQVHFGNVRERVEKEALSLVGSK